MSWRGDSLGDWVAAAIEPTRATGRDVTDEAGERITRLARANAPVDTGRLKESLKQMPVRRTTVGGYPGWTSGVETRLEYALSVEHGSGLWGPRHAKYLIKPRNPNGVLSWVDRVTGERRFAKYVWHPGQPPQKFVARAVAQTEAEFGLLARRHEAAWQRRVNDRWRSM